MDYNRRKQPIYFYNPRPNVLSVLKGVCLENFVHVCTQEELDYIIQGKSQLQLIAQCLVVYSVSTWLELYSLSQV